MFPADFSWTTVRGGPWPFCHEQVVDRSKKRSRTIGDLDQTKRPKSGLKRKELIRERDLAEPSPLTKDEAKSSPSSEL